MITYIDDQLQTHASRITTLLQTLSKHAHAKPDLQKQSDLVVELENELHAIRRRLPELIQQAHPPRGSRRKYRDSVVRRFAHKLSGRADAFEKKTAAEEKDTLDGFQEVIEHKERKGRLEKELEDARRTEMRLERAVGKYTLAQGELEAIYDTIFSGPTPQYPEEDVLELAAEEVLREYDQKRQRQEKEQEALQHLQGASRRMENTMRTLAEISTYREPDWVGGVAVISQAMDGHQLALAQKEWQAVLVLHAQARKASNKVGPMPNVKINAQAIVASMAYYGGLNRQVGLERSEHEMVRAAEELKTLVQSAKRRVEEGGEVMREVSGRLEAARSALQDMRTGIFMRVAQVQ